MNRRFKAGSRPVLQIGDTRGMLLLGSDWEPAMNRQSQAIARTATRSASFKFSIRLFGLLPLAIVCTLMLMQILGVWNY